MADRSNVASRLNAALEGRYRIERELGEGGMATVYLAEDVRHDRKVAIKVLRPELAAVVGAERFLAEIKTTANLQHPSVLPLFDSGEADGFLFYVMPRVEGETLRTRLEREKQLPVDEAVSMALKVADALDYAHERGVVHRDVKPANILLSARGEPLVADFGIALAVSAAGGGRITETGLSLGTPHYMSPEQATGDRDVDPRSDVYALGCVLYEMLTGQTPFSAPTAQGVLSRILTEDPRRATELRRTVPEHVGSAVARALEKLPADRFESAKAFAEALQDPAFTYTPTHRTAGVEALPPAPVVVAGPWKRVSFALAATTVLFGLAAAWSWLGPVPQGAPSRQDLSLGAITRGADDDVVISPDGTMLVVSGFVDGERALYLRRVGQADFQKVPGTENGQYPSFSPDDQWIVYRDNVEQTIAKVAVEGGGKLTLFTRERGPLVRDPVWGEDGWVVFTAPRGGGGLWRVPGTGGEAENLRPGLNPRHAQPLPDGSGILVATAGAISLYDPATDSLTTLIEEGTHPTYVRTGHILYVPPSGGLFAQPFDLSSHQVTGPPSRVLDRVAASDARRGYSVSLDGTLVVLEGGADLLGVSGGIGWTRFLIRDFAGGVDTVRLPEGRKTYPRFSPDGRRIAYEMNDEERNNQTDIFTFDLVTGTNTQITFAGDNDQPVWSPDGKRLLFNTNSGDAGEDLAIKPVDNSAEASIVLDVPEDAQTRPLAWLDDDVGVLSLDTEGNSDLVTLPLSGDGEPQAYLEAPWPEYDFALSPDGDLAAVVTGETGSGFEVWLRDFPVPEGKWRVSFGGGTAPRWSPNGRTLYYWHAGEEADSLMAVTVDRDPGVVVRDPHAVLVMDVGSLPSWDLHPDGEHVIVNEDLAGTPGPQVEAGVPAQAGDARYLLVFNWFTELGERLGGGAVK